MRVKLRLGERGHLARGRGALGLGHGAPECDRLSNIAHDVLKPRVRGKRRIRDLSKRPGRTAGFTSFDGDQRLMNPPCRQGLAIGYALKRGLGCFKAAVFCI